VTDRFSNSTTLVSDVSVSQTYQEVYLIKTGSQVSAVSSYQTYLSSIWTYLSSILTDHQNYSDISAQPQKY